MAAPTNAQEEFDALMSSKQHLKHHPSDSSLASSAASSRHNSRDDTNTAGGSSKLSSTLTNNSRKTGSTLRSGQRGGTRLSSPSDSDASDDSSASSSYQHASYTRHGKKQHSYYIPRTYMGNTNTGPKGVIADAQAFEQEKRGGLLGNYSRTRDLTLPRGQSARRDEHGVVRARSRRRPKPRRGSSHEGSEDGERELDELDRELSEIEFGDSRSGSVASGGQDDETEARWRGRSVGEIGRVESRVHERDASRRRRLGHYGRMDTVTAEEFLEIVETAPRGVVVAVFIFDDQMLRSEAYFPPLQTLAQAYPHVRFVALHYAAAEIERAGVPCLLGYRSGDKFAGLVPLSDEVPFSKTIVDDLERALLERNFFK